MVKSVLVVEDNAGDRFLIRETLSRVDSSMAVQVVGDGVEALQYLRREAPYDNAVLPELILLDMNLPKKGGLEVLAELRAEPSLTEIPVFILSTSKINSDAERARQFNIDGYIVKPFDVDEYFTVIASTIKSWILQPHAPQKL